MSCVPAADITAELAIFFAVSAFTQGGIWSGYNWWHQAMKRGAMPVEEETVVEEVEEVPEEITDE